MDPQQTWCEIQDAFAAEDWDRLEELADALKCWLARDGFAPSITGNRSFDKMIARCTCEALLSWEIA